MMTRRKTYTKPTPFRFGLLVHLVWSLLSMEQIILAFVSMPNQLKLVTVPFSSISLSDDTSKVPSDDGIPNGNNNFKHTKRDWIQRSLKYYTTLRRIRQDNADFYASGGSQEDNEAEVMTREAVLMHAALRKIKEKKFHHAEVICKYFNYEHSKMNGAV